MKIKRSMLYNQFNEKNIHPYYLHLPSDKTMAILDGLLDNTCDNVTDESVIFRLDSYELATSVMYMLLRMGIIISSIQNNNNMITITVPKTNMHSDTINKNMMNNLNSFIHNGILWNRVTDINHVDHVDQQMYDFEIDTNHNYLTQMGLAHNGGGKRKGSIAVYLEPWHGDIFDFLVLRLNKPPLEKRALDMFLALWIPDLFMQRVKEDGMWSLMCPDECPNLNDVYGEEFEKLYTQYESEGKFLKQIKARTLWNKILEVQIETGTPYMAYKDSANRKSNQKNVGTIKSSNLCCEIMEYSDHKEYAVCNLCSIALPKFIKQNEEGKLSYDFKELCEVAKVATRNLNKIIDLNYYPVEETRISNFKHRPIGVGVQGLADVYNRMGLPFDSEEADRLNKQIFETIYFGCWTASNEAAIQDGPYETYEGSPISQGQFQFNMWDGFNEETDLCKELNWNWGQLRESIKQYGVRNSLCTAIMPTASTSQILGNNECIEPYTSNFYVRRTLAGEYAVLNENLVNDLLKLGLWNDRMKQLVMYYNGSIQQIEEIPQSIKDVYKTSFEMKQSAIVKQSVSRGPFIDQSQSLNIFSEVPNSKMLTNVHFYGWKNGLKTGMYYLRSKPAVDAEKFGLDPELKRELLMKKKKKHVDEFLIEEPDNDSGSYSGSSSNDMISNDTESNDNDDDNDGDEEEKDKEEPVMVCTFKPGSRDYESCEMCSG
jgi:ribonucleoside-diphosphate reductase alpha subunit